MKLLFSFCLFVLVFTSLFSKVRLLTFHYNEPEFIQLQYLSFTKFIEDEFELIVFNDGNTPERERAIREMCEKYGIQCVRYEQNWHKTDPYNQRFLKWTLDPSYINSPCLRGKKSIENIATMPSIRHAHVIQYALENYGYNHDDIVVILDGDIFSIRPISLKQLLDGYDIVASHKDDGDYRPKAVDYLWVTFIAFDPRTIPNKDDFHFFPDFINGHVQDTGSHSYNYLLNNPDVVVKKCDVYEFRGGNHYEQGKLISMGLNLNELNIVENLPKGINMQFQIENHFLHFLRSCFEDKGHNLKKNYLSDCIMSML
jgi:hypothetical protein